MWYNLQCSGQTAFLFAKQPALLTASASLNKNRQTWEGLFVRGKMEEQTKQCTKCGNIKLLSYFYKEKHGKYGVDNRCKSCSSEEHAEWQRANKEYIRVSNAKWYKDHHEYLLTKAIEWARSNPEHRREKNGRWRENHREQEQARGVKWRKNHPEYIQIAAEWRKANPERVLATRAEYYKNNGEHVRAESAEYRKNNPEKARMAIVKWQKNNPEKLRIYNRNRKARIKGTPGNGWSAEEEKRLLRLYGYQCAYCGKQVKLTMDHIIPILKGGKHTINNVVPACVSCNCSKGTKALLAWMLEKR